jgi:hypothetical protein
LGGQPVRPDRPNRPKYHVHGGTCYAYVKCQRWSEAEALLVETVGAVSRENRDWMDVVSGYVYVLM